MLRFYLTTQSCVVFSQYDIISITLLCDGFFLFLLLMAINVLHWGFWGISPTYTVSPPMVTSTEEQRVEPGFFLTLQTADDVNSSFNVPWSQPTKKKNNNKMMKN